MARVSTPRIHSSERCGYRRLSQGVVVACHMLPSHEGVHQGWRDSYHLVRWPHYASWGTQLHEPNRYEVVLDTEYVVGDCEFRLEHKMLRIDEYRDPYEDWDIEWPDLKI